MRIAITGSSGLVGMALVERLEAAGHEVGRVRRGSDVERSPGSLAWDPARNWIAEGAFEGYDAVINLAGASIGEGRWTKSRKRELRSSRIDTTRLLVSHLATLSSPPRVLVSASAVGYYGDRGEEVLGESASRGQGFLADLAAAWEAEAMRATEFGIRVVTPRFGVILAQHGGALPRMILPTKLGVGTRLGSGRQWMPWVTLDDVVNAIEFALIHNVRGPLNVVAPAAVTNQVFAKALGAALHRPAFLRTPGFALRILLGQAADELLLASARVVPTRLADEGFEFEHPTLDVALPAVLGQRGAPRAARAGA